MHTLKYALRNTRDNDNPEGYANTDQRVRKQEVCIMETRSTQIDAVLQGFMCKQHAFRETVLEELMCGCRWTAAEVLMLNALWQSAVSPEHLRSSIHPMAKAARADQDCPPALITRLQIIIDLLSVRVGLLNHWQNTTVRNH